MNRNKVLRVSNLPLPIFNVYEDEWDVISLPDNFCTVNPIHKTSKAIQNFIKKVDTKYDNFLSNLGKSLSDINKEIEDIIRVKCKALKKDIKILITNGHNYLRNNLNSYQTEILTFDDYKFEKCKKYCTSLITQGKRKIYDFYAFMKGAEKIRTEKFRDILLKSYADLLKSNTKSPYEVQLFFEDQILAYNQVILSNMRNYKEIGTHLILVFTNEIKLMLYKISKYERAWRELCKEEIINRLKEYSIEREEIENILFKNDSVTKIVTLFNNKIEDILEQIEGTTETKADIWLQNMQSALKDLDCTAKELINVYKMASDDLSNKYYIETEEIMEKMVNQQMASQVELSEMNKALLSPLHSARNSYLNSPVVDLNQLWKETIEKILEALYTKFRCLEELEEIFAKHEKRTITLNGLVIQDIKQLIVKHDSILQGKDEATLNIILDNLRRDSTKVALDSTLKRAQTVLQKISSTLEKQKEEQLRNVKNFYEYTDNELRIFKTELDLFLEKYSGETVITTEKKLNKEKYSSLYEILKETHEYLKEISGWKNKIIENIETLLLTYNQNQQNKTEKWIAEQEEFIVTNFDKKLDLHKSRLDRINKDIYEVRLAEIKMHESKFNSHNSEIQKCIENLFLEQTILEQKNSEILVQLYECLGNTQIENTENTEDVEIALMNSLNAIRIDVNNFEKNMETHSENVKAKINELYSQNLLFMKSMKLFHEGGNFSSAELKLYTKKMRQINGMIKKKSVTLKNKFQNYKLKLDTQIQEIRQKIDDRHNYAKLFHDFKIDVGNLYQNVQTAIKNVVVETKSDKNKTQALNDRLLKILQLQCNPYAYLNYAIADCKTLNERLACHHHHLQDYEDAPKLKALPTKHLSNISTKKSNISLGRNAQQTKIENFKLFDNEKDFEYSENKFLSKIRKILVFYLHELEKKAKKFYGLAKRDDCSIFNVSHTLRNFMWGAMQKFTYYYFQCLQIWIIEIRDFINLVHNLRQMLIKFCERFMNKINGDEVEILKKISNKYIKDIKENMNSALSTIKNTSDLLKPLYGYPGNQQMLNDLNEKMTNTFQETVTFFNTCLVKPKNYIENALNDYINKISNKKDQIEELYEIIPDKSNYENLVTQVKNIMFISNFNNLITPLKCTEIIDSTEADIGTINEIMFRPEPPPKQPAELKEIFLQNYTEILGENIEEIYNIECEFKSTVAKMKKMWIENVEKVIELYEIKYN